MFFHSQLSLFVDILLLFFSLSQVDSVLSTNSMIKNDMMIIDTRMNWGLPKPSNSS